MLDGFFVYGETQIILLLNSSFLFLVQLFFYGFFFMKKFALYREESIPAKSESVSVVICARNAYNQLKENLPSILNQDYPNFEVVVVNRMPRRTKRNFLLSKMSAEYPHLNIVEIRENLNFFEGKKFPLSIGIESATHDLVLLTDADCKPVSSKWIAHMAGGFSKNTDIVLGYGTDAKSSSLLKQTDPV